MFRLLFCIILLSMNSVFAAIDVFEFDSEKDRLRFRQLSEELRCPKCQNNNLAGSDAAIALDLRIELHKMIVSGQSDEYIKSFMVSRYGQFVLYKPAVSSLTYVLWYGPFALLFIGFAAVFYIAKLRRKDSSKSPDLVTGTAEREVHERRLKEILDTKND